MRKEYSKLLKDLFSQRLEEIAPEFKEIKVPDPVYPGQRTYQWIPSQGLLCFIILVPSPKGDDRYTIELGWSTLGKFPRIEEMGSWITIYKLTPERKEYDLPVCICRLGNIHSGKDIWWGIGNKWDVSKLKFEDFINPEPITREEVTMQILSSLDEVMPLLVESGISFLKKFAESKLHKENKG